MVKGKNTWLKNNLVNLIILIVVLGGVGFLVYMGVTGGFGGLFNNVFTLNFPEGGGVKEIENTPTDPSCKFNLDKTNACVGEDVTGTINDGSLKSCIVAYDYEDTGWKIYNVENLDINGQVKETQSADTPGTYVWTALCGFFEDEVFNAECRTNDAIIEIISCENCTDTDGGDNKYSPGHVTFEGVSYYDYCLEDDPIHDLYEYYCLEGDWMGHAVSCDEGQECFQTRSGGYCIDEESYEVGDVVGGGSGSGSLTGTDGDTIIFDLSSIEVGGDCYLGAKIYTNWEYANDECSGIMGDQGLEWVFVDSSDIAWAYADAFPQVHNVDLCPLNWDNVHPWKLFATPYNDLPDCELNYNHNVEIYVCECN